MLHDWNIETFQIKCRNLPETDGDRNRNRGRGRHRYKSRYINREKREN